VNTEIDDLAKRSRKVVAKTISRARGLMEAGPVGAPAVSPAGVNLHQKADAARSKQNWAGDIYYRRRIADAAPTNPGAQIQLGHAYKEAGFFARAQAAYARAAELSPDDAEAPFQLAHLLKLRGDLRAADAQFERAQALGHPNTDGIAFERALLARIDNATVFSEAPRDGAREGVMIYLSVPGGRISETDRSAVGSGLGVADYSYSFAMRGFLQALEDLEIDHAVIEHPEYISDIRERSSAAINIHLCFYPPERLRLLKGAYNINCFAWEFDRLRAATELLTYHAFADQATMLNRADEIWAPAQSAVEAIQRSGVTAPTHMVTAPIIENLARRPRAERSSWKRIDTHARVLKDVSWQPLAIVPRIQPAMNNASAARRSNLRSILGSGEGSTPPPVFLTIFNVHDFRKQLRPMLEAFVQFSHHRPDAILLLKMSTPFRGREPVNSLLHGEQVTNPGRLAPPLVSDRVWITDQILTRDEMNHLFDVADFYLCTSHGEGQNLPLIEAMGRGLVPVSVNNTAMEGYISEDNAVVIPSEETAFDPRMAGRYGMFGARTFRVEEESVRTALRTAADMGDEDFARRSAHALSTVRDVFGVEPFKQALDRVIADLSSRGSEAQ